MGENANGKWLDIVRGLIGQRLSTTAGTVDYNYDELSITVSQNGGITDLNDVVGVNYEINHFVNRLGLFKVHMHWWQPASTAFVITYKYRVQKNGQAKTTAWTDGTYTVGSGGEAFPYSSGTLNQISNILTLDLGALGIGVSDTIQFKFTRSDGLGGTFDAYFIDAHVQQYANGTTKEYTDD
jgi:hypothetical protein